MQDRNKDGLRTAAFWREKADEAHALSDEVTGHDARAAMRSVAKTYEVMARRAEAREKQFAKLVDAEERTKNAARRRRSPPDGTLLH